MPPYRFIPGLSPHPVRDPAGHSYGETHEKLSYLAPESFEKNEEYLFGVDLYNQAYWWEAHEAWEDVWHTTDKESDYGNYLQGLIQISAALIKWFLKEPVGMKKLYALGVGRLEKVAASNPQFMGVDLRPHLDKVHNHFAKVLPDETTWADPCDAYPFLVLALPQSYMNT